MKTEKRIENSKASHWKGVELQTIRLADKHSIHYSIQMCWGVPARAPANQSQEESFAKISSTFREVSMFGWVRAATTTWSYHRERIPATSRKLLYEYQVKRWTALRKRHPITGKAYLVAREEDIGSIFLIMLCPRCARIIYI